MNLPKFLLLVVVVAFFGCGGGERAELKLPMGTLVGVESEDVKRFLGIPYAQPTDGDRRWAPPVAVDAFSSEPFDATEFGPWCPQPDFDRVDEGEMNSGEGWTIFKGVPPNEASSEDCLSLNVWMPASGNDHPVMVFLHGNALGTSFPAYDGTAFARDGVVFVSINFRLHTMGNFAHPALTRSAPPDEPLVRYTEMDQLEALRWVQNNIGAFGGDVNNVTVVGSSNGGAGILQMLNNKAADGLFHKAIVQSGNGWWEPIDYSQMEQLGCMLASMAGLDGCNATTEELRSMRWHQLPVSGPYAIDDRHGQIGATQAIAEAEVLDVPLLIGWNDFDGSSLRYSAAHVIEHTHPDVLATYDRDMTPDDEDLAYAIYTDLHSGAPARWVAGKLQDGAPTFLYLFSYVLSSERGDVRGAEHAYELPHVMDSWDRLLPPLIGSFFVDDEDREMTRIMHACWVSFLRTGKPSCPNSPEWPAYRRETDQLMELNIQPKVLTGYRAKQLDAQEQALAHYLEQSQTSIRKLLRDGVSN